MKEGIIMTQNITSLSQQGAELLSQFAAEGRWVFRFAEATAYIGDAPRTRRLLQQLVRGGWLNRLERELYLIVPLSAGPERLWTVNAFTLGKYLVQEGAIAYWSALDYWGLTEQVPRTVFIQTTKRKYNAHINVAGVRIQFVYLKPERFFGVVEQTIDGAPVMITDQERTILDAAARPDLSSGTWQLVEVLQSHAAHLNWSQLDNYLARFKSGALYKRLGYLLETLDLPIADRETMRESWRARLTTGIAYLDPSEAKQGPMQRRWRICDNIGVREQLKGMSA